MEPRIQSFYDKRSGTVSHVVYEAVGGPCAVIDSVFDLDPRSGHTNAAPVEHLVEFMRANRLTVDWILETHIHHDHLSGAACLRERVGRGRLGIGAGAAEIERVIRAVYDLGPPEGGAEGAAFDTLFRDGETFRIGSLTATVRHTPGHTIDSVTYLVGDAAFVGDTIFMPDSGSARCDFHGGDARVLYRSVRERILEALPQEARLFVCHDYGGPDGGRDPAWQATVAEQRAMNIHLRDGVSEGEFVRRRAERDKTLGAPALLLPALQVNIHGGRLPAPAKNGTVYLKMPLNVPGNTL